MGRLLYIATMSVDGYVADEHGNFDFTAPDEERHLFVNDLVRRAGTLLMGRRMYDTLVVWEDPSIVTGAAPAAVADFRDIWLRAEKVVFSRSLETPRSAKTRIVRELDPAAIGNMKAVASSDLTIGGPDVAMRAMRAGLVDEVHVFVVGLLVGSGNRAFGEGVEAKLELTAQRAFRDGTQYFSYSVTARQS